MSAYVVDPADERKAGRAAALHSAGRPVYAIALDVILAAAIAADWPLIVAALRRASSFGPAELNQLDELVNRRNAAHADWNRAAREEWEQRDETAHR